MNFVISLASAKDRRLHISNEFEAKNIKYHFFDAVQPNQIPLMEEKYGIFLSDSGLTAGEKACFFSHVEVWNITIERNLQYVAVFDDDVFLGKDAGDFLSNFDWVPENFHIIKLEMFEEYVLMDFKRTSLKNRRSLRKLNEMHLGTAGYILSLEGAKDYLNYIKSKNINEALDHLMFESYLKTNRKIVYQMIPGLSAQADRIGKYNLESQLEKDRKNSRLNDEISKSTFNLMQKIKREFFRLIYQLKLKFCKVGFFR